MPCHLRPDIELAPVSARGYPPPCPAQHTSPSTSIHTGTRCSHLLSAVRQGPCFSLSTPHHDICDLCLRDGPLEHARVRSGALVAQGASRHCHGLILIRRIGRNHLPRASCRTTRACAMLRRVSLSRPRSSRTRAPRAAESVGMKRHYHHARETPVVNTGDPGRSRPRSRSIASALRSCVGADGQSGRVELSGVEAARVRP